MAKARNIPKFRIELPAQYELVVTSTLPVAMYIEKMSCLWSESCASTNNWLPRRFGKIRRLL